MSESTPRFASALSTAENTRDAVREVLAQIRSQMTAPAHLAFVFASVDHREAFDALAEILPAELGTQCVLGCSGESVVGAAREIEDEPALAVWVAHLPGVTVLPMHLEFVPTADGGSFIGWHDELADAWPEDASILMLADPFSFPTDVLLERFNEDHGGTPIYGGMASGASSPGENRLLLGHDVHDRGAVAVLVRGPITIGSVVSQGCRPIGRPMVVTKAQQNVIFELGGKPAVAQLQELFGTLTPDEQRLVKQGLHVGQVIDEYRETFGRGDFLIRNVQGFDPDQGAIAVGDYVHVGRTIQFHVRDAGSADEDLDTLLTQHTAGTTAAPAGALVFTCNGRGTRLFEAPHHDAAAIERHWNSLPTAGFFAAGEIGPVGGKNFLHGFTASIVLFS